MRTNLECPVELLDYQLYRSKSSGNIYCSLIFNNVTDKIVKGLKTTVYCFDQFDEPVNGKVNHFECKVEFKEGLNRNQRLEADEKVSLLDFKDTKKIEVDIIKVLFTDQTIWEKGTSQLEKVELKEIEDLKLLEFVKARSGADAKYYANKDGDRWSCVCGRLNYDYHPSCKRCGRGRDDVLTEFTDEEKLRIDLLAYEEEKAEKQRIAEEDRKQQLEIVKQKARKVTKYGAIVIALLFVISATAFGFLTKFTFSMENYHLLRDRDNALLQSVKDEDLKTLEFLLKNGADTNFVNSEGELPIVEAIKLGNVEIVAHLIGHGALTEGIGEGRDTILHLAVEYDQVELLRHLISKGLDINQTNGANQTIFEFALFKGHADAIDYLVLEKVININSINSLEQNAIHTLAIINKNENLFFDYFAELGIDIAKFDQEGNSPLFYAIKKNNKNMINLLVEYGADIDNVTSDGQTALDVATSINEELIGMFKPLLLDVKIDKKAKNINISGVTLGTKMQEVIDLWGEPTKIEKLDPEMDYFNYYYEYRLINKYGNEVINLYFYDDWASSIVFETDYHIGETDWYKNLGEYYGDEGVYYQEPGYLLFIDKSKKGGSILEVDNNFWYHSGTIEDYLLYVKESATLGYVDLLVKDITEQEVINILGKPDFGGEYGTGTYIAYIVGEYALYFSVPFFGVEPTGSGSYYVDEIWVSEN